MHNSRVVGAAVTLPMVVAAAGCGGSSGHGSSDSTSAPPSTHATTSVASSEARAASTTTSSTPTTSSAGTKPSSSGGTAAGAPGVPEAARQHTKAGAIAFARHYIDVVNETAVRPKVGVLEPLALSSCKTCDNQENTVKELVRDKQHFNGSEVRNLRLSVMDESEADIFVKVHGYEPEVAIVDAGGNSVQSFPEVKDEVQVFNLRWTRHGWRIAKLQGVK